MLRYVYMAFCLLSLNLPPRSFEQAVDLAILGQHACRPLKQRQSRGWLRGPLRLFQQVEGAGASSLPGVLLAPATLVSLAPAFEIALSDPKQRGDFTVVRPAFFGLLQQGHTRLKAVGLLRAGKEALGLGAGAFPLALLLLALADGLCLGDAGLTQPGLLIAMRQAQVLSLTLGAGELVIRVLAPGRAALRARHRGDD
jgi:hypothetical protein